ncbi:Tat pathway signal protein [Streptomyces sp. NPDC045470]|uniref:Tat pathway signal protein n=1 Tax=Streptomyces sp. NPDC045470 TaxID=3155469 RepID=UPI0033C670BE
MERRRNEALVRWMDAHGMTVRELADEVNTAIGRLSGRQGQVSERTIHNWRSGTARWPQSLQSVALHIVTGRDMTELGFVVPARRAAAGAQKGETVHRRRFVTATAGSALGVAGSTAGAVADERRRRVGMSDVERLTAKLADVVASDNRHGGTVGIEARAGALARQALDLLQRGTASARVRGHLYSLAAAFTSSAMWAAIDGRRLEAAQQHMHQAVTLAGLSADAPVQFRVWGHAGALYRQLGRYTDALAADDAARATSIVRRDPLYASLAHARTAVHLADLHDPQAVLRSLGHAQDALGRAALTASDRPRPPWMDFYDQAELELLALIAHHSLGRWADTEAHAHRHLAQLRPDLLRNRALALVHLARAQLEQDALTPALATARAIPRDAWHGRTERLLTAFTARLQALAPDTPEARAWADHLREKA